MAVQSAVVAGTAQAKYASLYSAMQVLKEMRQYLATGVYSTVMDYNLVLSVAPGSGRIDSRNKAMTFPRILEWSAAWKAVSAAAAPGTPVIAASGQTVREALRLLDQILLWWGQKKLDELYAAATVETRKAQESVARAQAAANAKAAQEAQAAASEAERQRIYAQAEADRQRIAAEAEAATKVAAAAELAAQNAAIAKASHDKTVMWGGIAAGGVALLGIVLYLTRRKR
jgi:hypothetical protein